MKQRSAVAHVIDRLWPDPAAGLSLDEAFGDLTLPPAPAGRPLVGVNMVTSIDGPAPLAGARGGGGRPLTPAFLAEGLIDELYWTIGARLVGTNALPMIAPIPGGSPWAEHPRGGGLISVRRTGEGRCLRYRLGR